MYKDEGNSDEEILAFYLGETGPREKIKCLFPEGDDGTTVINVNGDVFHALKNKNGEYIVNGDGKTFRLIIEEFKKYEIKNGTIFRSFKGCRTNG